MNNGMLFNPQVSGKHKVNLEECLAQLHKDEDGYYHEMVKLQKLELQERGPLKKEDMKGEIAGTAVIYGKVDDRPLFISNNAFKGECGKKVHFVKSHMDHWDFVLLGSAWLECGIGQLSFKAKFNLLRDPVTEIIFVQTAGEMFAHTWNGDLDGISAGLVFSDDDIEFDEANNWIIVNKAEIRELSLVIHPAIDGARVTEVMDSKPEELGENLEEQEVNVNSCPCADAVDGQMQETIRRIQKCHLK